MDYCSWAHNKIQKVFTILKKKGRWQSQTFMDNKGGHYKNKHLLLNNLRDAEGKTQVAKNAEKQTQRQKSAEQIAHNWKRCLVTFNI